MCFFPFSIHIFSIFQMVCACSRALSLHFPKIHPHYIHIGVCSCQVATLHLPIRRWVSPTLVSVWVCLGVKLPLRQVLLASWLEQVYRRRSHRTELCTWLWTRHWRVKPLPPSLPLVFFFQCLSLLVYLSPCIHYSPVPILLPIQHWSVYVFTDTFILSPAAAFVFWLVGTDGTHTNRNTAMHDQTNSVEWRRLMGE